MTTPLLGFGLAPLGTSPFGTGTPANAGAGSPRLFRRPDGSQGDAALIDPVTRDFVLDATQFWLRHAPEPEREAAEMAETARIKAIEDARKKG